MERKVNNGVVITKITKYGNACYMLVPSAAMRHMAWRDSDTFAMRFAGRKAIIEPLALEKAALIRTGEVERPA